MVDYVATAIKMCTGCEHSDDVEKIDKIYLVNSNEGNWYTKEVIHDHLVKNPETIAVGTKSGPKVVPRTSVNGNKYVKSAPNHTTKDNLLELPRK